MTETQVIRAQWIISEKAMQNLHTAGISTGWLKAWLLSAGATEVSVHFLESGGWHRFSADWQLFFADESELVESAYALGLNLNHDKAELPEQCKCRHLLLENPDRICWLYQSPNRSILFLSPGDIAFQRHQFLKLINSGQAFYPFQVLAGELGEIQLETGLSASFADAPYESMLNHAGLLPEEQLIQLLKARRLKLRSVESCTSGAIISRLCRVPGASDVVDRSWVTYSNAAKSEEVAVAPELIERDGAVSEAVVCAMAEGGAADGVVCIAVSGIAGPGGGTIEKPVGTVWIAVSLAGKQTTSLRLQLSGSRHEIQARTVIEALHLLLDEVEKFHHK